MRELGAEAVDSAAVGHPGEPVFLPERESVTIVDGIAVHEAPARRHLLVAGRTHHLSRGQRPLPGKEIQDARAQRSRRVGQFHAERLVVHETAVAADFIPFGAARNEGAVPEVVGPLQTERPEEPLLQELGVAQSREAFDKHPEQVVAGVVVLVAVAGLELEGRLREQLQHGLVTEVEPGPLPELRHLRVALDPRGVVQQPLDRHLETPGVVVRQVLAQIGRQIQLSLLDQQHGGGGRELLGDRPDAVDGVGRRGHVVLEVRIAETVREDDLAALLHPDREPGGRMVPESVLGQFRDLTGESTGHPRSAGRGVRRRRPARGKQSGSEQGRQSVKQGLSAHGRDHRIFRRFPTRTVTRSRSSHSSSGIACLRLRPKRSLNHATSICGLAAARSATARRSAAIRPASK